MPVAVATRCAGKGLVSLIMLDTPEKSPVLQIAPKRLVALAKEMFYASSYLESENIRQGLLEMVAGHVQHDRFGVLNAAGEYLFNTDMDAYNCLLEVVEAYCESAVVEGDQGNQYQFLLVAIPIVATTQYTIPAGSLDTLVYNALRDGFAKTLLSEGARLCLAPELYTVDRMPVDPIAVYKLAQRFIDAIEKGKPCKLSYSQAEVPSFMADARYLVAGVMVEVGNPLFSWQDVSHPMGMEARKDKALAQWQKLAEPLLAQVMPGCSLELLLPGGFFNTCRNTEQEIRPATLRAAVYYLWKKLQLMPEQLGAVVSGFGHDRESNQVEEYRIGFYDVRNSKVVYGTVWPVFGVEELSGVHLPVLLESHPAASKGKGGSQLMEIFGILRNLNVTYKRSPVQRFVTEYCDDCGAPLFADTKGELVHAEMPEDLIEEEVSLH